MPHEPHFEAGREVCRSFRFVHIRRHQGDAWQVTRVVSYGHEQQAEEAETKPPVAVREIAPKVEKA
jgi:hypothetical protein